LKSEARLCAAVTIVGVIVQDALIVDHEGIDRVVACKRGVVLSIAR